MPCHASTNGTGFWNNLRAYLGIDDDEVEDK